MRICRNKKRIFPFFFIITAYSQPMAINVREIFFGIPFHAFFFFFFMSSRGFPVRDIIHTRVQTRMCAFTRAVHERVFLIRPTKLRLLLLLLAIIIAKRYVCTRRRVAILHTRNAVLPAETLSRCVCIMYYFVHGREWIESKNSPEDELLFQ